MPGDTIEVSSGTYYEHVFADKNNLKIIGENSDTTIIDANMQGGSNHAAVYITGSNVLFSGFTVQNCPDVSGITVYGEKTTIIENNIMNNTVGIRLFANNGKIARNNVHNNSYGIWMQNNIESSKLYYNNFFYNTRHFYQQQPSQGSNSWDNGYAGNFWSNYTGTDTSGDGIGETPYIIDSNNIDYYPLMSPYMYGDVIHDGRIDIRDVSFVARRFGCTPANPLWSPKADINEDGKIDVKDVSIVARKFGKIWS
jgi:parallel beta-helix repeat protein